MKNLAAVASLLCLLFLGACDSSPTEPNVYPQITSFTGTRAIQVGQQAVFQFTGFDPDGDTVSFRLHLHLDRDPEPCAHWRLDWGPYVDNDQVYEEVVTWEWGPGDFQVFAEVQDANGRQGPDEERRFIEVLVSE
ncbi:MAG: hypothetical protein GY835_02975 [bacterium]|nr:hypothetical protein [bacterium]